MQLADFDKGAIMEKRKEGKRAIGKRQKNGDLPIPKQLKLKDLC